MNGFKYYLGEELFKIKTDELLGTFSEVRFTRKGNRVIYMIRNINQLPVVISRHEYEVYSKREIIKAML